MAQIPGDLEDRGLGIWGPTYTEEEALVFLDGPQAAEEAGHHDDGADGDDEVGCRQRGEAGGEGGEVALGHGEPDAHAEQPAATELEEQGSPSDRAAPAPLPTGLHSMTPASTETGLPRVRYSHSLKSRRCVCVTQTMPAVSLPVWQMGVADPTGYLRGSNEIQDGQNGVTNMAGPRGVGVVTVILLGEGAWGSGRIGGGAHGGQGEPGRGSRRPDSLSQTAW